MEPVLQEIPPSPQSTVCFAKSPLPAEASADPDTSLLEIASTVLGMGAFVPADTGLCFLLWQGELLGTGCKLLCIPAEQQQTWPSLLHPAQGTAAPQCCLTFCGTLFPDMMKLIVYCFGLSLCLKCCSWLLLVVIHHYNH